MKLEKYELAIQDFNKCIEIASKKDDWIYKFFLPFVYLSRGGCYQRLGDQEKAQADFAKAKELGK